MARLVRWDPFRDLGQMQRAIDRALEDAFFRPWGTARRSEVVGSVPVDIYETDEAFIIRAPMPGVTPEHLDLTYEAGVLTIRGEVVEEKEVEGDCICQERPFGKFARSISLPSDVVPDEIRASLRNGVLTLHVPKAEEVKPKKISVKVSEA